MLRHLHSDAAGLKLSQCFEDYETVGSVVTRLPCRHFSTRQCIAKWFKQHQRTRAPRAASSSSLSSAMPSACWIEAAQNDAGAGGPIETVACERRNAKAPSWEAASSPRRKLQKPKIHPLECGYPGLYTMYTPHTTYSRC